MIDKSFMEYDLNVFMILLESTSMTKELGWPHWKDVMFYFGHFLGFIPLVDQTDVQNSSNDLAS